MKNLFMFLFIFVCLTMLGSTAWGQLLVENFNFSGLLTSNGWTAHSGGGTNPISTTTGLSYSGYAGSGIGNAALVGNAGGEDDNRGFTEQAGNGTVVYYSFLVNVNDASSSKTGDYFIHIGDRVSPTSFTLFAGRVFARIVSNNVNFGLSNTSTATWGATNFAKNTTYLLVVKYTINTSGNDTTSLWVLSSGIPASEAAAGTAEVTNTSTAGTDVIDAIALRQGSSTTQPQTVVDGIRIGTSWSDLFNVQYRSTTSGNWNSTSTWEVSDDGGSNWSSATSTPTDADGAITIRNGHTVTVTESVSADQLTVASGANLTVSGGQTLTIADGIGTDLTVNGTLEVAGTIAGSGSISVSGSGSTVQIDQGGWPGNTNTYTYDASGRLVFNNSSGSYGVNSDATWWPSSNGPQTVVVQNGGGMTLNVARTVGTLFQVGNGTATGVVTNGNLTIGSSGTCEITSGGYFTGGPIYAFGSTLKINTGGTYGRSDEWSATSGQGYPHHVQISGSTTYDLSNNGASTARQIGGDLTIDVGSTFTMDDMSASLTVLGSVTNNGTLTLGSNIGGDLNIAGNYSQSSTFNPNNRAVIFNGTGTQTITAPGGMTFDYLTVNKSSGSLDLNDNITVDATLTITDGILNTGSNKVILGPSGSLSEAGSGDIVIGTVEATRTVGGSNETFGNIGIELSPNNTPYPGSTTVTRVTGTAKTGGGNEGIKRYYDINAGTNTGLDLNLVFHYDDSPAELNEKDESKLYLFRSPTGSDPWSDEGYTSLNTSTNTITLNNVNNLSVWTASDSGHALYVSASFNSDIQAVASSEAATISSLINDPPPLTSTEGVQVWQVTIRDGGGSSDPDALPTELVAMTLTAGSGNEVSDWSAAILSADLFDGSTHIDAGVIGTSSISFPSFSAIAPDNGNKTLSVRISLKNPLPSGSDNKHFVFEVLNSNVTAGDVSSSSQFSSFSAQTSSASDNKIDVVASKLAFTSQPPTDVDVNTNFSAAVTAQDVNNNTDVDYSTNITLSVNTGTGTLSSVSGLSKAPTNGVASWNDLQYDVAESGISIKAQSGTLTDGVSNNFTAHVATSTNSDVVAVSSSESATISSLENDPSPLGSTDGVQVWQVTVRDGGGSSDADNLPTILTSITFNAATSGNTVPDWSGAILAADLFDGSTHIASGTIGSSSIAFTSISVSVSDDNNKTLSLRISLKNPLPTGSDGKSFRLRVRPTDVTTEGSSTSSQFASFSEAVSASGQNVIDVTATQLAFTTQPQTGKVANQNIAPVAVTAQDANQNTDLDFSGNVTLSSGTFTLASTDAGGLTQAASNGVASWTNLTSSTSGTGTILADAAGLTQGVSNSITVLPSIVTSVQSGNWSAGTTWDQGSKPTELQTAIIASGHTVTLTANDTCEAATVQTGGVLDCGNYALRLHGTFTLDSGAEAKMSAFNPLPGNGPTPYAFDIASTFTFYGGSTGFSLRNPSVQTVTFGNVNWISINNATPSVGTIIAGDLYKGSTGELRGGTGSIARVITVLGNVVVDGGTLVCNNGTATGEWDINGNLTINSGGKLRGVNYTGNGTLRIGGNLINNGGIIQVEDADGGSGNWIVYFKGTGTTNLDPGAVNAFRTVSIAPGRTVNLINNNMTINSTYTMTDSGTFNCGTNIITGAGNFTLEAGATLGIGSPDGITASSAAGNIQVTGTRTFSSAANYVYNGSAAQVTGDGLPTNVNNLTINNSSGVTLSSNHTVDGTLYLMSGNLNTGVDVLTIAQTGSVNRTSGHVVGNLNKYLTVSGGSGSQTWEIGDASVYTPVDISGTSYASGFDLTASTTTGEHPNIGTSNINPAKSVNRYYTLTGTPTGPSSVTFHFDAADVDGGANTSNFIVGKYDNPTWTYPAVGTRTSTSTQVTGVTSFSDFAIGEVGAYTIVATAGPHGVIDPSGTVMVNSGENQRFVFDPEACYKVDSVFVDGVYEPDSTTSYTFKNVTDNHTIHVTFAAIEYTITVTQGANGTITPGTTVVGCGSDLAFSITPNAGYHVDSVFVDGSYVPDSTTSYTFKNITANHSITAKFAINTYTLNVVVVGSGSVTKDPNQTLYEHGTSVELTAVPADLSWKFKEWSGDLTGTENPKSIVMNGPKSVTATFERDSSYLVMYRSFDPDSIADSKDLKGNYKYIPRKATACEFEFELTAPQSVTLTLKFSMASDGVVLHGTDTVGTWTNAKTVTTSAIDSGEVVHVIGWGYKGKPVKTGYIWATLPKSMKGNVETYIINQPRLPMPNRLNAVNDAFALGGFPSGLQVGLDKSSPDSTKLYGWLSAKKYGDVAKTLNDKGTTHSELPHGFDFWISSKPFVKLQKSLSPNKYDNILLAQMVALKLNITASAMEILPLGFGELIFDDATLTPPAGAPTLNGLMVKEVAAIVDSVMMGWTQVDTIIKGKPVYSRHFAESDVFDFLNEAVTEINNAFEGELDTLSFSDSLKFKGAVMLVDVPYLRSNSGVVPAKITPNYVNIEMVPEAYKLYQNYPNPFNPTTMIQFDVPEEAYVTLKIYNLLGQEVATLLDHELMTEGTQEVEFDATGFASGVYFYRLSAEGISNEEGSLGTFQTVKKMILMK
jgi:hypothetical protein